MLHAVSNDTNFKSAGFEDEPNSFEVLELLPSEVLTLPAIRLRVRNTTKPHFLARRGKCTIDELLDARVGSS